MRGQTTLDFAIGITVFLVTIIFLFGFVPGIIEPFDITNEEQPAVSDRVANSLAKGTLGNASEPYVLDRYCTVEFFDGSNPTECNYDGDTLAEITNLEPSQNLNVSLEGNVTDGNPDGVLCWDESDGTLVEADHTDCSSGDVELQRGEVPPADSQTTITARRVVSLHHESVTLEVVVW